MYPQTAHKKRKWIPQTIKAHCFVKVQRCFYEQYDVYLCIVFSYCPIKAELPLLCITVSPNSVLLWQTQEGRAGEAHVGPAGEQTGADGAAGGTHEAAKGKTTTSFKKN